MFILVGFIVVMLIFFSYPIKYKIFKSRDELNKQILEYKDKIQKYEIQFSKIEKMNTLNNNSSKVSLLPKFEYDGNKVHCDYESFFKIISFNFEQKLMSVIQFYKKIDDGCWKQIKDGQKIILLKNHDEQWFSKNIFESLLYFEKQKKKECFINYNNILLESLMMKNEKVKIRKCEISEPKYIFDVYCAYDETNETYLDITYKHFCDFDFKYINFLYLDDFMKSCKGNIYDLRDFEIKLMNILVELDIPSKDVYNIIQWAQLENKSNIDNIYEKYLSDIKDNKTTLEQFDSNYQKMINDKLRSYDKNNIIELSNKILEYSKKIIEIRNWYFVLNKLIERIYEKINEIYPNIFDNTKITTELYRFIIKSLHDVYNNPEYESIIQNEDINGQVNELRTIKTIIEKLFNYENIKLY